MGFVCSFGVIWVCLFSLGLLGFFLFCLGLFGVVWGCLGLFGFLLCILSNSIQIVVFGVFMNLAEFFCSLFSLTLSLNLNNLAMLDNCVMIARDVIRALCYDDCHVLRWHRVSFGFP